MSVNNAVRSMKARMPWESAQKILQEIGAPRGQGWEKTAEKLTSDDVDLSEQLSPMVEAIRDHILVGEKLSSFYQLEDAEITKLRTVLEAAAVKADSPFAKAYPFILSEEDVATNHPAKPHLIAVEKSDAGIGAVFASTRAQEIRVPLLADDLPEGAADALSGYEEVVGIKHVKWQAMDVVWVPNQGNLVDVRIDYPKGMTQDQGEFAHEQLRAILASVVGQDFLISPQNLFPLVDAIYRSTEGTVVELAFGTSTASLKHEKMRRTNLCLRSETYHVGGTQALTLPIQPYKISVQWDQTHSEVVSRPELGLHGTFRMTHTQGEPLLVASIKKCINASDYEFVRSRLEASLAKLSASSTEQAQGG